MSAPFAPSLKRCHSTVERDRGVPYPDPAESELGAGEFSPGRERRRQCASGHVNRSQPLFGRL